MTSVYIYIYIYKGAARMDKVQATTYLGRSLKAWKPVLEATSHLRAWNCPFNSSKDIVALLPTFSSMAVRTPFISLSLFLVNRPS